MVFLAVAIMLWTPNMTGQQTALPKLNLAQIEGLVSHGVPDATMAAQIQRRGLAFKPTSAIIESLRAKGAGPLTIAVIETAGPGGGNRPTSGIPVQRPVEMNEPTGVSSMDAASPGLSQARRVIPIELKAIFHALDEGNPQGAGQFISPNIANSGQTLDAICRPFNYRTHYVEAIIERPGPVFEARIRVLYKPFDEHAVILTFRESGGAFQLVQFSDSVDEWFSTAKETTIQMARKFLYAARAHEAGVITGLVSTGIDSSRYTTDPCWQQAFGHINDVSWTGASLEDLHGLKIHVVARSTMNTRIFLASEALSDFWFDKVGDEYKIVAFVPMRQNSIFLENDPPAECRNMRGDFFGRVEDPDLEQSTRRRFGLLSGSPAIQQTAEDQSANIPNSSQEGGRAAPVAAPSNFPPQPVQITINDPAEFNSYQLAVAKTNPAAKAAALEQFLQNYPRSAARTAALRQLIEAYRQSNQPEKASDAAKRLQPEAAN
jgi:hypothetical protein